MPRGPASVPRFFRLLLPAILCVPPAHAQRPGSPIVELPAHGHDLGAFAQFAQGHVLTSTGAVQSFGGALDVRFGRVTLTAGVATLDAHADNASSGWSVDAAVAPEVCASFRAEQLGGGFHPCNLIPNQLTLRLRAGAAYSQLEVATGDATMTDVTLGGAVAFVAPIPMLTLELWTAPRLHVRSASPRASLADERTTHAGVGWTLGLAVTGGKGFGVHVSIDELLIARPPGDSVRGSFSFGAGLHFVH